MKYLVAYPIRGEAGEYLTTLGNSLAEEFKLEPVANRIDPHLTIKAPFEANILFANSTPTLAQQSRSPDPRVGIELANSISEIEDILETFTKKEEKMPLRLEGFNHFNGKVIVMDVHAPKQTHMMLRRLQDKLRNIPWLSWQRTEFPLTLHATVCYPKTPEQAKEILRSLKKKSEVFDLSLDTMAIFQRFAERWQILREFPI